MINKAHRIFLIVFLVCTLVILLPIAVFNYLMDPFDYFEMLSMPHINEKKLPGSVRERFDKAIKIISKKPKAIMLGSSRVRAGFPVTYYSQLTGYPALKVGFSGAQFQELFAYFEHALQNQPDLKAVFLNLDFYAFSKNLSPNPEYSDDRLRRTSAALNDIYKLLLSMDTLKFSYETYKHNRNPENFKVENRIHVKIDEDDYVDLGLPMINTPQEFLKAEKRLAFDNYDIDSKKIDMFRKIVATCKEKNIDLKVVFSPTHVNYWEMVHQCNRWDDFENLKRRLCVIYPIYDFSGYNAFNAESLSKEKAGTYFFETSHFTPYYGRLILDKVYGIEDRCPDTGFLLTSETIEDQLQTQRNQREEYIKSLFD